MTSPAHKTTAWMLGLLLFGIMAAHALLETARDALFLAKLGPAHLASAYFAIAVIALVAVCAVRRWGGRRSPRRALIGFLAAAAGGTAGIAVTITTAPAVVFVLYVWTGLVATLTVPALWMLVDRVLRIGDAKKLFGAIGAGGVLGALLGSAAATGLAQLVDAHHLISVAAAVFAVTAIAAIAIAPEAIPAPVRPRRRRERTPERQASYVRWLLLAGLLSTITLTFGDLMFKRILAERVADHELATTFGAIYTVLNLIGLLVQLVVTPRLLERLGVGGALTVLPLVVFATVMGFVLTGAGIAIVALKLGDGGLRHSVHRVATEILFLPIAEAVRETARPLIDAIGQRGGQAAAAVTTFAIATASSGTGVLALVTAIAAAAWLVSIIFTRRAYVQQFRDTLDAGEIHRDVRIPTLDHDSISMLTGALASPDESEALAALDILAKRGDEVPALVLYHPSPAVVRRALTLLQAPGKRRKKTHAADVARVLGHLANHPDPEIRANALAASSRTGVHRERLRAALNDVEPDVRAAAIVGLAETEDMTAAIEAMTAGSITERAALARAIGRSPHERFRGVLLALLDGEETAVVREVLRVWLVAPELSDADRLIALLHCPHVRGDARRVFAVTDYFDRLVAALDDARTPLAVRRHLPRTISRFATPAAAAALVGRLMREPDGTTEFKILRALGRMRADNPALPLDLEPVHEYVKRSIADAMRYADLGAGLAAMHDGEGDLSAILIAELLVEKRAHAIERVFRALGIIYPRADLRNVHDAIISDDEDRKSAGHEILEDLLPAAVRLPLAAVVDESPTTSFDSEDAVLAALLADPSDSLRALARDRARPNDTEATCVTPSTVYSLFANTQALPTPSSTSSRCLPRT
jgi:ATP/ADP translocase